MNYSPQIKDPGSTGELLHGYKAFGRGPFARPYDVQYGNSGYEPDGIRVTDPIAAHRRFRYHPRVRIHVRAGCHVQVR
jgi:hypothetical protein